MGMPHGFPSAYVAGTGAVPCASSRLCSSVSPVIRYTRRGGIDVRLIPILFTCDNPLCNKKFKQEKEPFIKYPLPPSAAGDILTLLFLEFNILYNKKNSIKK
jgi:hypothetical protein